jgi:hypothetical protein
VLREAGREWRRAAGERVAAPTGEDPDADFVDCGGDGKHVTRSAA